MKVFEFAKEVGVETITLMDKIRDWKIPVKSHMASLTDEIMNDIRSRLEEEKAASSGKKKKKTVKKKAAAKKTAAKKTTAKKKTVKKATGVKKTAAKKKTVKKATGTSTGGKKKVVRKASTVIRRKAADVSAAKAAAEAAPAAFEAPMETSAAGPLAVETEGQIVPTTASAATTDTATPRKRNIVGKMDLTRVTKDRERKDSGSSPAGSGPGAARSGPQPAQPPARTGLGRNIRTGFVAAQPIHDTKAEEERAREKEREEKKRRAAKEQGQQAFTASDFRKREVIFQPKKKRVLTGTAKKTQLTTPKAQKRVVRVHDNISVAELAQQMSIKTPQLIKKLMAEGEMANNNTMLDFDTVSLLVPEFGFEVENVALNEEELLKSASFGDLDAEPITRPPVVTVMGHVDHGKTTLLDAIRNANVVEGEAGGITQHIGAYNVSLEGGKVATFIDTPGHAAFTAMRARGANVTDVAIIVVAADDGMMPQTEEAISHAQAANVPIIVAVNKMDKEGANPDRIKQQLADKQLIPEEWGGDTMFVPVSALKKEGITELLENIHLVAEVLDLKANPKRSGTGIIIESKMEKGKGNVATLLVQDGTVRVGEDFVAGFVTGRIRRMTNDKGKLVKEAGPGVPIEVTGLDEAPNAGDRFDVCETEEQAREIAELRRRRVEAEDVPSSKMSLDAIFSKVKAGDLKELNVVLKTDVAGTSEAIKGVFSKLDTDEVKVKVVHSAVGGITENDVLLASTSGGIVIGFNVRPDTVAQRLAKEKGVEIKTYSVIYNLSDDIKAAMAGLLDPDVVEETLGAAEVRDTFTVPKIGTIAGCFVTDGKVSRNSMLRLTRDGKIIYEGKLSSLKRFKDDVKEVASGYECGIGIENYNDIKTGDIIEAYTTKEVARTLE